MMSVPAEAIRPHTWLDHLAHGLVRPGGHVGRGRAYLVLPHEHVATWGILAATCTRLTRMSMFSGALGGQLLGAAGGHPGRLRLGLHWGSHGLERQLVAHAEVRLRCSACALCTGAQRDAAAPYSTPLAAVPARSLLRP